LPYASIEFILWYGRDFGEAFWREADRADLHLPTIQRLLTASRTKESSTAVLSARTLAEGADENNGLTEPEEQPSPVVTMDIQHLEMATGVDPIEAALTADAQLASFIAEGRFPGQGAVTEADSDEGVEWVPDERVFLLDINRPSKGMCDALDDGRPLRACRDALDVAGHPWKLLTGTRVFVHPEQYRAVMRALNGQTILSWHVVMTQSLEHLVEESLAGIGKGAWARDRTALEMRASGTAVATTGSASSDAEPSYQFEVKRTFLCVTACPRPAATVAQSTTEAHENAVVNPRRVVSDWCVEAGRIE